MHVFCSCQFVGQVQLDRDNVPHGALVPLLMLRFAERMFDGCLSNVAPQRRRGFGRRRLEGHSTEEVGSQAIGVGV